MMGETSNVKTDADIRASRFTFDAVPREANE